MSENSCHMSLLSDSGLLERRHNFDIFEADPIIPIQSACSQLFKQVTGYLTH